LTSLTFDIKHYEPTITYIVTMGNSEISDMDEEIVEDFASHHIRMGKSHPKDLKKMVHVSEEIVEQLGEQGLNATDIAFIMIEVVKQLKKKKLVLQHDMAFV